MAGKRRRDFSNLDTQMVEIYEDLANEHEDIRLKAAHRLVSKFASPESSSPEEIKTIVQRLFKGLCSGRKAARLGFSIALTEFLAQVFSPPFEQTETSQFAILDILRKQTVLDGSTTGQDERDHYIGRLFGAEAIIKSCILFKPQPSLQSWQNLLHFLCELAIRKQWLRQECGWLLFTSVTYLKSSGLAAEFAVALIDSLNANNLIRTPEGVAIWLEVKKLYPDAALPKKIWKHRNPLRNDESAALAEVMKDAKAKQQADSTELAAPQGAGVWGQQLHFSWDVVVRALYLPVDANAKSSTKTMTFQRFWTHVVDKTLFSPTGSPERKHWGFLLLAKVVATCPVSVLQDVFTANTVHLLVNHLKIDERYLHKSASKVVQALQARAEWEPSVVTHAIRGLLLEPSGLYNFDKVTKTKTIANLLKAADLSSYEDLVPAIREAMEQPQAKDEKHVDVIRRGYADVLVPMCSRMLSMVSDDSQRPKAVAEMILDALIGLAYAHTSLASTGKTFQPPPIQEARTYLRSRIKACLDQSLQKSPEKFHLLRYTINRLKKIQSQAAGADHAIIEFDAATQDIYDTALKNLRKTSKTVSRAEATSSQVSSARVLETLYCLAIFQLYDGDEEAPGILQDLNLYQHRLLPKSSENGDLEQADAIVEILLSFASKPSKFFHKTGLEAFRAFTDQIGRSGLRSLVRVLETKESSNRTQDVFDVEENINHSADGVDNQDPNLPGSDASDSDSEMLDSDVEQVSEKSNSSEGSVDGSEADNAELELFDAKLAAALGTRKGRDDIDAEDSEGPDDDMREEDMDQQEMAALDEKLAEVFRARKPQTEQKKERKDLKEAIINLKRRVLDLIEVYLAQEILNPLVLDLVLPLITTARTTSVKQVSNRAHEILQAFCSRCKGSHVPVLDAGDDAVNEGLESLKAIHDEAGLDNSRIHGAACSRASVLLVKVLIKAKVDVGKAVDVYAETRKKQLLDRNCKVLPMFFTEWNNWCISARDHLAA